MTHRQQQQHECGSKHRCCFQRENKCVTKHKHNLYATAQWEAIKTHLNLEEGPASTSDANASHSCPVAISLYACLLYTSSSSTMACECDACNAVQYSTRARHGAQSVSRLATRSSQWSLRGLYRTRRYVNSPSDQISQAVIPRLAAARRSRLHTCTAMMMCTDEDPNGRCWMDGLDEGAKW